MTDTLPRYLCFVYCMYLHWHTKAILQLRYVIVWFQAGALGFFRLIKFYGSVECVLQAFSSLIYAQGDAVCTKQLPCIKCVPACDMKQPNSAQACKNLTMTSELLLLHHVGTK